MADGDGAAADVVLLIVDFQPVAAVQALRGEGFVELPQIDVGHLQPVGLEQLRYREHRADAHFIRFATGHGESAEERPWREAQLDGLVQAHHQRHGRAIGQLRRVTGGDRTILGEYRLEARQAFQRGIGAIAVIAVNHAFVLGAHAGLLVLGEIAHVHRHDLVGEQARRLGAGGALLALQGIDVLLLAGHVITTSDPFGRLPHAVIDARYLRLDDGVEQVIGVLAVERQADGLDPAGDDHVAAAGGDLVGGHGDGLQSRGAVAVQSHARAVDAQARQHGHVAADVVALCAFV